MVSKNCAHLYSQASTVVCMCMHSFYLSILKCYPEIGRVSCRNGSLLFITGVLFSFLLTQKDFYHAPSRWQQLSCQGSSEMETLAALWKVFVVCLHVVRMYVYACVCVCSTSRVVHHTYALL